MYLTKRFKTLEEGLGEICSLLGSFADAVGNMGPEGEVPPQGELLGKFAQNAVRGDLPGRPMPKFWAEEGGLQYTTASGGCTWAARPEPQKGSDLLWVLVVSCHRTSGHYGVNGEEEDSWARILRANDWKEVLRTWVLWVR